MKLNLLLSTAILGGAYLCGNAQTSNAPQFVNPAPGSNVVISSISDNGKWGVSEQGSVTDGDIRPSGGVLINLETLEQFDVSDSSGLSGVSDVTDDGKTVVGEAKGLPGYWTEESGKWHTLPLPAGYGTGRLNSVTPDGRFAVGYASEVNNIYAAFPIAYDLKNNALLDLPGLPRLDMTNKDQKQNFFMQISADGRYVLGEISQSYVLPVALCCYVYDLQTGTYKMIGFRENHKGAWVAKADGLTFVDRPTMHPNGKWVTGYAYMVQEIPGSEWPNEFYAPFRYNVENDEIEVYTNDNDMGGFEIMAEGSVIACSPAENPYSFSYVRSGKYFVGLDKIFKQVYNIDYAAVTGFDNTGKPIAMSADGSLLSMIVSPDESYLLRLSEPLTEAAKKVNLLAEYQVAPSAGSTLSSISTFVITFDREVATKGVYSKITFKANDGSASYTPLQSNGFVAEGKTVKINFRTRDLQAGKKYTLTVPAGMITLAGDSEMASDEIKFEYIGRSKDAVKMTEVYPADNASVASIDLTSNPMLVTFDTDVVLGENAMAHLYRESESTPICDLYVLAQKNQILCYPLSTQRLFNGTNYRVVIPAGTVTDLSGNGPNEEIVLNYRGSYIRPISADDRYLFNEDCSSYENFLFFEGDKNVPAQTPASWGFTQETTPWYIVRGSNESTDMALASHSMYNPAGQSDDWMTTPQLFIPDSDCFLSFDAQSYVNGMDDRLKVIVYPCNVVYNTLTREFVEEIRSKGDVVFNEVLNPGATQEGLEDEWTKYTVDLAKYAGKDVYIAFLNDNRDQSAVFVDNIQVIHDLRYLTSFENSSRVVNQSEITIRGSLTVASEIETYTSLKMVLKDGASNVIDEIADNNVNLAKNDVYQFRFEKPLQLKAGVSNVYSVEVTLNDRMTVVNGSVKNLMFEPVKKVVIEEYSGRDCGNCPQGYVAFDYIRSVYGSSVVPVTIRTYQSDPLGSGLTNYSLFLGLDQIGAPSARVNRGVAAYPMINTAEGYKLSGAGIPNQLTGKDETLWFDLVRTEMETPAELEIGFSSKYDESSNNIAVNCEVRSALNSVDNNINLFAVIIENGVDAGYQANYFSSIESPVFGEWGKGGRYGSSYVIPFTADEVARGTWGTTYNGTGGLIPEALAANESYSASFSMPLPATVSNLDNCEIVVMMIDAATGRVINSNIAAVNEATDKGQDSVESVGADKVVMGVVDGNLYVASPSASQTSVFDVTGVLIATGSGDGEYNVDLNGYTGFAIARVATADGVVVTKKLVVR